MPKTDVDYVESAYSDAIGVLFKQLFMGLDSRSGSESDLVAHFSIGFAAAKRAKELAVGVVKPATIATANVRSRGRQPATR